MGLAVGTAKCLVFFFNFIFFVSGVGIIAVGGFVLNKTAIFTDHFDAETASVPIFLIVVGVFVALISFFGCCGAMRNNHCMLMTFAFLLGLIFVCEFAAGIAAYVKRDAIVDVIHKGFDKSFLDYGKDNVTTAIDSLQQDLACCGSKGPDDWKNNTYTHEKVPYSCCDHTKVTKDKCDFGTAYKEGCYDAIGDFVTKYSGYLGAAAIAIAFIQILGIVLACCLASAVKDQV